MLSLIHILPKTLNFFESAIRSLLKEYIERGKVDVFISYEDYTEENYSLKYNAGLAEQYMTYLKEMAEQFGIENDVRVSTLSRYPDVFVMEEQSPDEQKLSLIHILLIFAFRIVLFNSYTKLDMTNPSKAMMFVLLHK